jgi:hypothetical protein
MIIFLISIFIFLFRATQRNFSAPSCAEVPLSCTKPGSRPTHQLMGKAKTAVSLTSQSAAQDKRFQVVSKRFRSDISVSSLCWWIIGRINT